MQILYIIMHAKVFSIQIFQYVCQIPLRVCTLVLFIAPVGVEFNWRMESLHFAARFYNFYIIIILQLAIYITFLDLLRPLTGQDGVQAMNRK